LTQTTNHNIIDKRKAKEKEMPTIYKTKIDHSEHPWVIRQDIRQDKKLNYIPDIDALVYYQLWCKKCNKPVGRVSHDEAWKLYKDGVEFINLKTKIKNSRYKNLQREPQRQRRMNAEYEYEEIEKRLQEEYRKMRYGD
jgi:hypothetical protein